MIEFAQPWMLVGLLAALLPIAIHRLGRRRARRVRFSALAFLLQQRPENARRMWLRERLLLAVRVAAIAAIALVLAKPLVPSYADPSAVVEGSEPVALVVVLDDSLSMGVHGPAGDTRFEAARARAIELLGLLPLGSHAAVVASGLPARAIHSRLRDDLATVAADVRSMVWHARRDDARRALAVARQLLSATAIPDRRIVVLSDLQKAAWAPLAPRPTDPPPRLFAEPQQQQAVANTSIVALTAEAAPERGPQHVRVRVELQHRGSQPFSGNITIVSGDREARRRLELTDGERATRAFVLPAAGEIALASLPSDSLAADNSRLVLLSRGAAIRIAMVNGAPRPVPREDEVFFAARALRIGNERGGDLLLDVLQLDQLATVPWQRYDVIVLANVAELPETTITALVERIEDGAGLLVTAGDSMPVAADGWPARLLPWVLQGVRTITEKQRARAVLVVADGKASASVTNLRRRLRVAAGALAGTPVRRHALVRPSSATGRNTVLRFADGAPALLLARRGKGKVALWTTSIDRDWGDLALQPGFLPLLGHLSRDLAGSARARGLAAIEPGQTAVASRHPSAQTLEVRSGDADGPLLFELAAADQEPSLWRIGNLLEIGRYHVTERSAGATWSERTLLVQAPPSEMAIDALDDPQRWRNQAPVPASAKSRPRVPGWPFVLVIMLVLLLMESTILAKGRDSLAGRSAGGK